MDVDNDESNPIVCTIIIGVLFIVCGSVGPPTGGLQATLGVWGPQQGTFRQQWVRGAPNGGPSGHYGCVGPPTGDLQATMGAWGPRRETYGAIPYVDGSCVHV